MAYNPDVVVLQCGADCITGDPLGTFNLTPHCISQCVDTVLCWNLPVMILGGGERHDTRYRSDAYAGWGEGGREGDLEREVQEV